MSRPMELTILGSGTAVPSVRRGAPGYLLRVGDDLLLFDCGGGTLQRLLRAGVRHDQVTHILISHNHLDHSGELASWLFASRIPASARTAPLTILGSSGFMQMLASLRGVYGHWLDAATYRLDLIALDGDITSPASSAGFNGWSVHASAVNHIESSLAFRVTNAAGKSFVYSGDTDVCDEIVELARAADLLLIEASFPDDQKVEGHLTASEAGEIARSAGARRVVLTHFYPACDEADMLAQVRRSFGGDALLAEDAMRLTI